MASQSCNLAVFPQVSRGRLFAASRRLCWCRLARARWYQRHASLHALTPPPTPPGRSGQCFATLSDAPVLRRLVAKCNPQQSTYAAPGPPVWGAHGLLRKRVGFTRSCRVLTKRHRTFSSAASRRRRHLALSTPTVPHAARRRPAPQSHNAARCARRLPVACTPQQSAYAAAPGPPVWGAHALQVRNPPQHPSPPYTQELDDLRAGALQHHLEHPTSRRARSRSHPGSRHRPAVTAGKCG